MTDRLAHRLINRRAQTVLPAWKDANSRLWSWSFFC
jgi:hypothetical protein